MRNLGPASERMLVTIGIHSDTDLRQVGSAAAYVRLSFEHGQRISKNLLWAMEAALLDIDWRDIPATRKMSLDVETAEAINKYRR